LQDKDNGVFQGFEHMFDKEKRDAKLPRHQPWDHEINLEPGAQLQMSPIYRMSPRELEEVKKYIDVNL